MLSDSRVRVRGVCDFKVMENSQKSTPGRGQDRNKLHALLTSAWQVGAHFLEWDTMFRVGCLHGKWDACTVFIVLEYSLKENQYFFTKYMMFYPPTSCASQG